MTNKLLISISLLGTLNGEISAQPGIRRPGPVHRPQVTERMPYKPRSYPTVVSFNTPSVILVNDNLCLSGGFAYERFLNKFRHHSVEISAYYFGTVVSDFYPQINGFTVLPAFRYHPQGNAKRVDYSVGLAVGGGRLMSHESNPFNPTHSTFTNRYNFAMALGQFNANFQNNGPVIFGLHASSGVMFGDELRARNVTQVGMKIGFRF